jgi:hypothetical protein
MYKMIHPHRKEGIIMSKFAILALVAIRAEGDNYYSFLLTVFNRHPELLRKLEGMSMDEVLTTIHKGVL